MAGTETAVVRLSEMTDGLEAVCFALLVKKVRSTTKRGDPYVKCYFRDKRVTLEAPFWHDNRFHNQAGQWAEGIAYRLRARCEQTPKYGLQLQIFEIRPATDEDGPEGYDFFDLVETSRYEIEVLFQSIKNRIKKYITDPCLRRLVEDMLEEHGPLFKKMPAAQSFHHSFTAGLLEHVWSMTKVAGFLADHYAEYYEGLVPPLNKGVIVAAAVLHDIGKLKELTYHPAEAKYTKAGKLIGHVQMGRDMVREAARKIEGFPEETLLLLEHAILSHHGKLEFGAAVLPLTLEALLVSFVDDLDAKMNMAARQCLNSTTDDEFTDKVFALDNRRFYKGLPADEEAPDLP